MPLYVIQHPDYAVQAMGSVDKPAVPYVVVAEDSHRAMRYAYLKELIEGGTLSFDDFCGEAVILNLELALDILREAGWLVSPPSDQADGPL